MKRKLFIILLTLTAAFTGCRTDMWTVHAQTTNTQLQTNAKAADSHISTQSVRQFGWQLMEQYLQESNPVMSPVSAYILLSMAGNGAKGTTKKEFQNVLGSDMLSVSESLMQSLPQKEEHAQLTIANSAWMDSQFTPKQKWLETAKDRFQADVFQASLGTAATKNKINKWVRNRTNQLIPKLLDEKLDKNTRLALINTLYFKADWQQQFLAELTGKSNFWLDNGSSEKVDMMHAKMNECGYLKDDTSVGVVLPYQDSSLAFVAIKPSGKESIRDWFASYNTKKLSALIESRKTTAVELALPKFKVRCRLALNDSLQKMGIKKAFDASKADLSLLGKSQKNENLYLSFVLQEAVLSVAEEGTEAAAASMGGIAGAGYMPDTPVVHFDRSFLYLILDTESNVPVFMGIVDQP